MKKHLKYLSYIIRHKWFVLIACCRFGIPFRGITHDLSKLLPSEWLPYCRYFYGTYESWDELRNKAHALGIYPLCKEDVAREFDEAWLFHQHRNPHHWQFWILKKDDGTLLALEMPRKYVFEMLCDWIGAGRAITGRYEVREWWQKNRDKMILHPETRKAVQWLIDSLGWLG